MDYRFSGMGTRNFEHIAQALALKAVGPRLSIFGDGPDGGREASWDGPAQSLSRGASWDGFGVVQAKMRADEGSTVAENLAWLLGQLRAEFSRWAAPDTTRQRLPEYYLAVTNVRLSPGTGGGKESIIIELAKTAESLGLPIRDFRVWDYDDLRAMIDGDISIRRSYRAWITPGDVLEDMIDSRLTDHANFRQALRLHASRTFNDDSLLNLRQAGSVSDEPTSMTDVFIDLPLAQTVQKDGVVQSRGAIATFRELADTSRTGLDEPQLRGVVLIGGPGQGKSTVTQYLAQTYRSVFLAGTPMGSGSGHQAIARRSAELGIDKPEGRRWPIRVLLTDLADALARDDGLSLLGYIAAAVSHRSSVQVSSAAMLEWLAEYPWLLIVDGLDEVPNSSNRVRVMTCLSDFYLEARDSSADLLTVATTRPQGYGGEFASDGFATHQLAELPMSTALEYAGNLVALRNGADTPASQKIMDRLRLASEEESTARLFSSPLQVSILTILVEILGHVPRDRWKLFSAYYRVISQREQQKPGELAKLLQDFDTEVDYIHRQVGYMLQARSAGAGETSSFLTTLEFEGVISSRLRDQGHSDDQVARLSLEFARLATDRLVFLTKLTAEKVGFEIRSLQEFMAGEYFVSLPDVDVMDRLSGVSNLPHWRNTVLFSIGCIYATKEHLKAEVGLMCANLDLKGADEDALLAGSELALDVILDGAVSTQPKYSRPLAQKAAQILDGPLSARIDDLAAVRDTSAMQVVKSAVGAIEVLSSSSLINRARAMSKYEDAGESTSLRSIFADSSGPTLRSLIQATWQVRSSPLVRAAESVIDRISPSQFVLVDPPYDVAMESEPGVINAEESPIMAALAVIFNDDHVGNELQVTVNQKDSLLSFLLDPIGFYAPSWHVIGGLDSQLPGWKLLALVGRFDNSPNEGTLADILRFAASAPLDDLRLLRRTPWVVRACFENALALAESHTDGEQILRQRLKTLAVEAERGALGTTNSWLSCQQRVIKAGFIDLGSENAPRLPQGDADWDAPVWPGLVDSGYPFIGSQFMLRTPSDKEGEEATLELASKLAASSISSPIGSEAITLGGLAQFTFGALNSSSRLFFEPDEDDSAAQPFSTTREERRGVALELRLVRARVSSVMSGLGWSDGISIVDSEDKGDVYDSRELIRLGTAERIYVRRSALTARWLMNTMDGTETDAPRMRLACHFFPRIVSEVSQHQIEGMRGRLLTMTGGDRVCALLDIALATAASASAGDLDSAIELICKESDDLHGRDTLGLAAVLAVLRGMDDGSGLALSLRGVVLNLDDQPFTAAAFAEVARTLSQHSNRTA